MPDAPPPSTPVDYNAKRHGFFGQLGEGDNAHIKYLQTAITREELDQITLIQNIPGSEQWDVKDLFQRDVDDDRVEKGILPYFRDESKVKFFNPLTLLLLPMQEGGVAAQRDVAFVDGYKEQENGHEYEIYERAGHFKFKVHQTNRAYSMLEWNSQTTKIVAIDGQHRLSALKRWKEHPDGAAELSNWTIPVVVLGVFRATPDANAPGLLEIVRKIFMYINSEAREVNEARKILLDDEGVNAVCTQALIQDAHKNDCREIDKRNRKKVPLIFYDWRGAMKNNRPSPGPAAVKSIQEIHGWLENFVLGSDGSEQQEIRLGLDDIMPPLKSFGEGQRLTHDDAARVRNRFVESVYPGVAYLLENFLPYKEYIESCRDIEKQQLQKADTAAHAFIRLRFGTHRAPEGQIAAVDAAYTELIDVFTDLKQKFDELISRDIGMRAVMYAFGQGKEEYDKATGETKPWADYAAWFTASLNGIYLDGWFKSFADLEKKKREQLTYVAYDAGGSIINYKEAQQRQALGAIVGMLIFVGGEEGVGRDAVESAADSFGENLKVSLRSGFRKHFRAQLEEENFQGTKQEIRGEVNRRTEKAVNERMKTLRKMLGLSG